jgi:hypothetical protein
MRDAVGADPAIARVCQARNHADVCGIEHHDESKVQTKEWPQPQGFIVRIPASPSTSRLHPRVVAALAAGLVFSCDTALVRFSLRRHPWHEQWFLLRTRRASLRARQWRGRAPARLEIRARFSSAPCAIWFILCRCSWVVSRRTSLAVCSMRCPRVASATLRSKAVSLPDLPHSIVGIERTRTLCRRLHWSAGH